MKSRILAAALFACVCLLFPSRSVAQGCIGVMKPEFSSYDSYVVTAMSGSTDTLSLNMTVDGYTQIGNTEYCNISGAIHTPKVYATVNGVGGWSSGPGASPYSYIDYTGSAQANVPDNGTTFEVQEQTEVVCTLVGAFYSTGLAALWPKIVHSNYILISQTPVYDANNIFEYYNCQYQISCGGNMGTCEIPPTYKNINSYFSCDKYLWTVHLYFAALGKCVYNIGWAQQTSPRACD